MNNPYTFIPVVQYLETEDLMALRACNRGFKKLVYDYGSITKTVYSGDTCEIENKLKTIVKRTTIIKKPPPVSPWLDTLDGMMFYQSMGPYYI